MTISWQFYADAGLTLPLNPVAATQVQAGGPADILVYFGCPTAGRKLQNDTAPGTAAVTIALYDTASGSGLAATAVTLGLSAGELASNTPGAALAVGVTLLSGAANAVPIFLRFTPGAAALGTYAELQLQVTAVESAA